MTFPERFLNRLLLAGGLCCASVILLDGCRQGRPLPGPPRRADPLLPVTTNLVPESMFQTRLSDCRDRQVKSDADELVSDLVLSYANMGRDFHAPAGPDGFLLRVTPLDRQFRVEQVDGDFTIGIYEDSPQAEGARGEALRIWYVAAPDSEKYWTSMRLLDGFLFQLDWGESELPVGDYIFWLRLDYRQGGRINTICQKIPIQDRLAR